VDPPEARGSKPWVGGVTGSAKFAATSPLNVWILHLLKNTGTQNNAVFYGLSAKGPEKRKCRKPGGDGEHLLFTDYSDIVVLVAQYKERFLLRYIGRRIGEAVPIVFIVCVLCFTLIQIAPFDAIDMLTRPDMPPEMVQALKARYGLDQPAHVQFLSWLHRMFSGDLGYSLVNHQSVALGLSVRLPNTILLVLPSYMIAVALSVVLGLLAGMKQGGRLDRIVDALCAVGMATPPFWIGMLLIYIFAYVMNLLPILGMHTLGQEASTADLLRHMVLPCVTLTSAFLPETTRYVRSAAITRYQENYVMVQRAFGSSEPQILFGHVMKNVLLPVITLVGMSLPMLITGTFVTESIFSWPGVGTYFLTAIQGFDYPVIMVVLLFSSIMVILGNLLADICYCLVDPRIKSMR
jgi:peptide/nickel transport system permease protein